MLERVSPDGKHIAKWRWGGEMWMSGPERGWLSVDGREEIEGAMDRNLPRPDYESGKKQREATYKDGKIVDGTENAWTRDGERIPTKENESSCCRCLVSAKASTSECPTMPDDYCFAVDSPSEATRQCMLALELHGAVKSSARCLDRLCAGDCWFLRETGE